MKFCTNCGNKFTEPDKFCSNCGTPSNIIHSEQSTNKIDDTIHIPGDLSEDEIGKYIDSLNLSDFYEGELLKGQKHGRGILMNSVWDVGQNDFIKYKEYEGNFKNDKREGFGVEYNLDGEKVYEGYWSDDKYNGKGKYYSHGILYYNGAWLNGIPHGEGEIYDVDTEELVYQGKVNNGLISMNGDTYKVFGTDDDDPLGLREENDMKDDNDPLGLR